uniref:Uncharacterized protein n=1 Tax=Glossina pallidipes TaxID=7398 RepID=A0A1A9ZSF7_GLOPL
MQPTLIQVPPIPQRVPAGVGRTKSKHATFAPKFTASLAQAKPPDPTPMQIKSKSTFALPPCFASLSSMPLGFQANCAYGHLKQNINAYINQKRLKPWGFLPFTLRPPPVAAETLAVTLNLMAMVTTKVLAKLKGTYSPRAQKKSYLCEINLLTN